MTLTYVAEAVGVARWPLREAGLPVVLSFTVETDGRLPDGTALGEAMALRSTSRPHGYPSYYMVNCAHPTHVAPALANDDGSYGLWLSRIEGLRPNASRMSHAELDEAPGARRGRPGRPRGAHGRSPRPPAQPARRRRLLRHRQPPRRRAVGGLTYRPGVS